MSSVGTVYQSIGRRRRDTTPRTAAGYFFLGSVSVTVTNVMYMVLVLSCGQFSSRHRLRLRFLSCDDVQNDSLSFQKNKSCVAAQGTRSPP
jgi:hypothetical protein